MFLLPQAEFIVTTDLTPDEVRWRLFRQIQPETDTRRVGRGRRFEGRITGNQFELEQIKGWGREAFPPTIIGEIKPRGTGAIVKVEMNVDPLSGVGMIIWLSVMAIITAGFTLVAIQGRQFGAILGPLSFVIVCYGWFVLTFKLEAAQAQQFLEDLVAPGTQRSTTALLTEQAAPRRWYGGRPGAQRYGSSNRPPEDGGAPTGEYDTQKFPSNEED